MDKTYERIVNLKNDIIKLKEKKASLEAILDTLVREREKYINELRRYGVEPDEVDRVIEENKKKIEQISLKIDQAKKFLEKFTNQL